MATTQGLCKSVGDINVVGGGGTFNTVWSVYLVYSIDLKCINNCDSSSLSFDVIQVCNHPELFERRDVRSPIHVEIPSFHLPKLIYREGNYKNFQFDNDR